MGRPTMVVIPDAALFALPFAAWADAVARAVPELDVRYVPLGEDPTPHLAEAEAALGMLTPELLAAAPRLRWLQCPIAAPPPAFFFPALVEHPVVVTNLRGVYRDNVADHVMAFVLAFARGLPRYGAQQAARRWHRDVADVPICDLGATTMLIVGCGEVGAALAPRARAFGMRVVGVDSFPERVSAAVEECHPIDALDSLLPLADWVVLTVPHTPVTEGMFDAARFAHMKSTACFMNIGRGETVRLDDLSDSLAGGVIAGAAIDVSELEPLPASHPLWDCPNVLITPHVASFGRETDSAREAVIVENAQHFVRGEPLRYVVDKLLRY